MPEAWTGRLVGKMHNAGISKKELAEEIGCSKAYVTMLLSGARKPANARARLEGAYEALKRKKNEGAH